MSAAAVVESTLIAHRTVGAGTALRCACGQVSATAHQAHAAHVAENVVAALRMKAQTDDLGNDAGEVNELAVAFACLLGLLLAPVLIAVMNR